MRLPIDVFDTVRSGTQIQKEREKPVRIAVFVEFDAPDELVESVREHLRPASAGARLHIEVAEPGTKLMVDPSADAVVGIAGSGKGGLSESLAAARERAVPTALVALAEDRDGVARRFDHPLLDTLANEDPSEAVALELGDWLSMRIPAKRLALAHNFAFMRRAVALEHVRNTALQNALIGAVTIIPGADMPLMTANQAKMVLQIAAAYGEVLGAERAKELLGVVGGAFAFRTAARQVVGMVPGFGWAIKGGIGYTGTLAMGYAAIKYFEGGVDLEGLKRRFDTLRAQVASRRRSLSEAPTDEIEIAEEIHTGV